MVDRNVEEVIEAIREWELKAGEGFTDYFMDNWPVGSWAYWLLGKGHTQWANDIINKNEEYRYVDQELKFEFYDDYDPVTGDWSEELYRKNVRVWAEFLVESDQYFRRLNEFFQEYFKTEGDKT